MGNGLTVMVVDDTTVYRMIMRTVVESIAGAKVTGFAANGELAMQKLARAAVDVVLLDVEMPVMDGFTTLKHITRLYPDTVVIMVSGTSHANANIVVECLNAGALDFVTKPLSDNVQDSKDDLRRDLAPILEEVARKKEQNGRVATAAASPRSAATPQARPAPSPPPRISGGAGRSGRFCPELVLIGSSTGGPSALGSVLGGIGRALPVPILIVQHMPPLFTNSLAAQLSRSSGLPVRESQDGQEIKPGSVTLAAGGKHIALRKAGTTLIVSHNDGPKVNGCRPAVDVLFMSVMASFPGPVLTVILTGMGRDGANGVQALKRAGKTFCITQNQATCVVYGMPRAAEELGLSDESLPLDRIGGRIMEICT